jgi:hypothetical protein
MHRCEPDLQQKLSVQFHTRENHSVLSLAAPLSRPHCALLEGRLNASPPPHYFASVAAGSRQRQHVSMSARHEEHGATRGSGHGAVGREKGVQYDFPIREDVRV